MEENKQIKVSLSTVFLIFALIVIIVMIYYIYVEKNNADKEIFALETNATEMQNTIKELQEKIDRNSNVSISKEDNTEQTSEKRNLEKSQIPDANTDLSKEEYELIRSFFKGVWISEVEGKKNILVIDYAKRFALIDTTDDSIKYGTYTVEEKAGEVPKITLTYTSGNTVEFNLDQASCSYLVSSDFKEQYVGYERYYLGTDEHDEGIFNK